VQIIPTISQAAGANNLIPSPANDQTFNKNWFSNSDLSTTLNQIMNYVVGILIVVAIFYVIWAAYDFVTSNGSEEKVNGARKKIMYAMIGIIVALLAKGIVALVLGAAGASQ